MGISVSWVAWRGRPRADVLAILGLEDTGVPDPQVQRSHSIASLADGWSIVQSRNFDWASRQPLAELSVGGEAIGVQEDDRVMVSTIRAFREGQLLWAIEHDGGEKGVMDLTVTGTLPDSIRAIVTRIHAEQAAEDPNGDEVDLGFDIPTEAGRALCGYRHEQMDDPPKFTELRPPRTADVPGTPQRGFFARLFGAR